MYMYMYMELVLRAPDLFPLAEQMTLELVEWDEVQDVGEEESRDTREGSEGKGGSTGSVMQYCIIFCLHNSAVFPPSIKSSIKHYGCALAA